MGLLPCSSQHTAAQHQETLRHCHESGPRNVLHLIPALDCPQCPLVEWSRSRPGANVGVNAMPRTPQHTSCCGAVDELGAAAPQHHSTTAPQHHSHNCVLSSRTGEAVAVVACAAAEEEDRFPGFSDRAQPAPAPAAGCSGRVTSRVQ